MNNDGRITIKLTGPRGPAELSDFASVVSSLRSCIKHVCRCVAGTEDVEYDIVELSYSSAALATSPVENSVPYNTLLEISKTIDRTILSLEDGQEIDERLDYAAIRSFGGFSNTARKSGASLSIGRTRLTSAYVANLSSLLEPSSAALGSVTGRLEAINLHNNASFILYPPISGEEVRCDFHRDVLPRVLDAVEKNITAYGRLHYAKTKVFPTRVEVEDFEVLPETNDLPTLLNCCGVLRTDMPAIDVIREGRNEW